MKNYFLGCAAAAVVLSFAASADAAVTIRQDPSFVQPDENVQLDTDITPGDNVVRGTTNQTNSKVVFTSSSDNLVTSPQGQATITPIGAGATPGLNNLTVSLENLSTFTQAEFNILADVGGQVRFTVFDSAMNIIVSVNQTLFSVGGNGQNFFGFLADGSTPISKIQIDALGNTQIASIGQFRLSGINAVGAVPEPSTWMLMLLGMAGVGFAMRRKEKQTLRVRYT